MGSKNFILLSDTHATNQTPVARLDNLEEVFFRKFTYILRLAHRKEWPILIAGDLTHTPRGWNLLFRLIKLLNKYPKARIYTVFGQHDMYLYADIKKTATNMGILATTNRLTVLNSKPTVINGFKVYGAGWKEPIPKPKAKDKNILVIHKSLATHELYPNQKYSDAWRFLVRNKRYRVILAGDIHRKFYLEKLKRFMVNTGPLIRYEATEYNIWHHHPGIYIYDPEKNTMTHKEIPHAKGTSVLSREHLKSKINVGSEFDDLIRNIVKQKARMGSKVETNIKLYLKENIVSDEVKLVLEEVMSNEKTNR